MNMRLALISILGIFLLNGCSRNAQTQVYIDNVNAEKRLLEDKLFALQYDYEQKVKELEQIKGQTDQGATEKRTPRIPKARGNKTPLQGLLPGIPSLTPPTVESGTPSSSKPLPKKKNSTDEMDDLLQPPRLDMGKETDQTSAVPMPLDRNVTQLYLDPARTGGTDTDGHPGDDALRIVFQPRNKRKDYVPAPGRVTIVLLDPEKRSRVAKWELQPQAMESALKQQPSADSIELTVPWKGQPPTINRLHLFVRYWPSDGTPVEADREITITPSGQIAAQWTPRSHQAPVPHRKPITVADNPNEQRSGNSDTATTSPDESATGSAQSQAKQARLPQWRPYR